MEASLRKSCISSSNQSCSAAGPSAQQQPQHMSYSSSQPQQYQSALSASLQHPGRYPHHVLTDSRSLTSQLSSVGAGSQSQQSSVVDEAYRRLGRRLSVRAHGDGPVTYPQRLARIGQGTSSGFSTYDESKSLKETSIKKGAKVSRKNRDNHRNGKHHKTKRRKSAILPKMTVHATDLFRKWQLDDRNSRGGKKLAASRRQDDNSVSLQRHEMSMLTIKEQQHSTSKQSLQERNGNQQTRPDQPLHFDGNANAESTRSVAGRGLAAVLENSSTASSTTDTYSTPSKASGHCGSSSTPRSSGSYSRSLLKGKCLTHPSEGVANNNRDNVDGNLILHENDSLSVSRKNIHVLTRDKMKHTKHADFRIQSLLGQGTFAQVFQCLHLQTGNVVAVKVIKNKPAYTRQAAMEIDVFRVLTKDQKKRRNVADSIKEDVPLSLDAKTPQTDENESNLMVDMVCYFMHKNHLCLVFEQLGLNLYEVLKKRQFRGLPLAVVRRLLKQAVWGMMELANKNVVHCDIKPENILLVTEDDVESVVSAGESIRGRRNRSTSPATPTTTASGSNIEKIVQGIPAPQLDPLSQSPANSLGTNTTAQTIGMSMIEQKIKLIDFGSACFEGQTSHTYIQSRFYRSPEVLMGLPYDSGIDMWSLGCVAAELFLGLPILPGIHEHDQLGRIFEMIGTFPDWMMEQGSKSSKYFAKRSRSSDGRAESSIPSSSGDSNSSNSRSVFSWNIKSQQEYIASLSANEMKKKGGLAKLEKQTTSRYFKRKRLCDIVMHKGSNGTVEDKDSLDLFIHFLYGILDPDPWKRWTAQQATNHPFLSGTPFTRRGKESMATTNDLSLANEVSNVYWEAPWDPNICRRKLLSVQKSREMQQTSRRRFPGDQSQSSQTRPRPQAHADNATPSGKSPPSSTHSLSETTVPSPRRGFSASLTDQMYHGPRQIGGSDPHSGFFVGSYASIGHQSQTDSSYLLHPHGSMNEVDFAHALHRPGVMPMRESFSSQENRSSMSLSSGYQGPRNDTSSGESTGQSVDSFAVDPRATSIPVQGTHQGNWHQPTHLLGMQLPPTGMEQVHGQTCRYQSGSTDMMTAGQGQEQQSTLAYESSFDTAQAFIQQQTAALQQQQALLHQRQAALVLQQQVLQHQQQLQAYPMNPALFQQQQQQLQQIAQMGNMYYVNPTNGHNVMPMTQTQQFSLNQMQPPYAMPMQQQLQQQAPVFQQNSEQRIGNTDADMPSFRSGSSM